MQVVSFLHISNIFVELVCGKVFFHAFVTEPIKLALNIEAKAWKMQLGKTLNQEYRKKMDNISDFVSDYAKRLARPIKDLDDVRGAMAALEDIRHNEIRIDMTLGPVEVRKLGKVILSRLH